LPVLETVPQTITLDTFHDGSRRKEAGAVATPKIIKITQIKKIISKILPIYTFANTTVHILLIKKKPR
jgi:hypothetical protein